ncbi:hypothetical protein N7539_008975 [Penicillium diatomitis]|uniref:Uncharacterized protein n=1 Tax=Penicillium diatomitis TaxID=2819901 RepID=A0A9X0BJL2_9EURO|nr:uncharacterized protein N7539_008975 [Penicillium diatomitis]KAJ5469357.1 hypothetical protein N7539_008975 [Penicillium diatomitis]
MMAVKRRLKTLDWGSDGLMVSMDHQGTFLHFAFYHPHHGVVQLSPYEQFDGGKFHDPSYVRSYRCRMLKLLEQDLPGFGLQIRDRPLHYPEVSVHRDRQTIYYHITGNIRVQRVHAISPDGVFEQTTTISTTSDRACIVPIVLSLKMSMNRASYGQLTEGGPIPLPETLNVLKSQASPCNAFSIQNSNLDAAVDGKIWSNREEVTDLLLRDTEQTYCGGPADQEFPANVTISSDSPFVFRLKLQPKAQGLAFQSRQHLSCAIPYSPVWKLEDPQALTILRGNLAYVLGNCMIPISDASVWQIKFLLDVFRQSDLIVDAKTAHRYRNEIAARVKGHLNWVFRDAQRPHGFWHRSYLANGVPKDGPIFQLDQQCYPILELCDFVDTISDSDLSVQDILEESGVAVVIDVLLGKRDLRTHLFPTDETPGDDPVEFPFHFSSHILLWYTFHRFTVLLERLGDTESLQASCMKQLAAETFHSTMSHFVARNPTTGTTMFAYLTDGAGQHTFYHDANDIPTLFAQEWGFASTGDASEIWTRTIRFGLSAANEGGFYGNGPFGGLGSVHTRAPWPLGYFQELVFAELTGDSAGRDLAWKKIQGSMFPDGLFSEAVDALTGECTSKAWFSWPGSMIGSALLRDRMRVVLPQNAL